MREQSWLNETLLACQWVPEGMKHDETLGMEDLEVTDDELQAVLAGDYRSQLPGCTFPEPFSLRHERPSEDPRQCLTQPFE